LGIAGRSDHEKKNVFEYKASQLEPPVQVLHQDSGAWRPALVQAIAKNPDGTLEAIRARALTVATAEGKQTMPFPRGWGEKQLRAAAEARGLLGGTLESAQVPPPETVEEFVAASRDILRAVFGPFEMDVYRSRLDGEIGPIEPTLVRFNLSTAFFRAVAKVGFHYFLWACPQIGGDEPEFSGIRSFVRNGVGEPSAFINVVDSLVDRIPAEEGRGTTAMRLRRSASTRTSLCRFISFLRRLALRFRRLSSDSASGPNRWRRSGGAFMWLRTRPISRVMTGS